MQLQPPEARVIGCLIEKQLATPQQYPLSVNALLAACNQSTNRDPVVRYDEATVRTALAGLRDHGLTRTVYASGSRTPKYAHRLDEHFELSSSQLALIGLLLLRGPQTIGELRTRSERMHPFESLAEAEDALRALADHPYGPLARQLERRPGQKEARWTHLLGEAVDAEAVDEPAPPTDSRRPTLEALAAEVAQLRAEVAALRELATGAGAGVGETGHESESTPTL